MKNQLAKNFKDLPLEINLMIFDYLDVNTILKLRLLSKDIKKIVENVRIKSMNVTNEPLYFHIFEIKLEDMTRFYFTNKLVNRTSSRFITKNKNLFKSNLMKILLSKIKILYIQEASFNKLNVFNLNNFKSIEQLQIESLKITHEGVLKLPNLKILEIQNASGEELLKFDTPKLSHLKTKIQNIDRSYFKFIYPGEITHLFLDEVPFYKYIEKFINLKSISINSHNRHYFDNIKFYFNFNKLEEIHMYSLSKAYVLEFIKDNRSKKIKFYLHGLLIESISDIDLYYNESEFLIDLSDNKLISSNRLGLLPYVNEINYTNLLSIIDDIKDFNSKFIHCFKVKLDHTDVKLDQAKFIDFTCRMDNLCVLEIKNSSFDQSFYDNLFKYCPNLARLDIDITERIDLNFLTDLTKLQKFYINQILEFNTLKIIINNLNKLSNFDFIFKNQKVSCYTRDDAINFTFTDLRIGVNFKKCESFIRFFDHLINLKCNSSIAMKI